MPVWCTNISVAASNCPGRGAHCCCSHHCLEARQSWRQIARHSNGVAALCRAHRRREYATLQRSWRLCSFCLCQIRAKRSEGCIASPSKLSSMCLQLAHIFYNLSIAFPRTLLLHCCARAQTLAALPPTYERRAKSGCNTPNPIACSRGWSCGSYDFAVLLCSCLQVLLRSESGPGCQQLDSHCIPAPSTASTTLTRTAAPTLEATSAFPSPPLTAIAVKNASMCARVPADQRLIKDRSISLLLLLQTNAHFHWWSHPESAYRPERCSAAGGDDRPRPAVARLFAARWVRTRQS